MRGDISLRRITEKGKYTFKLQIEISGKSAEMEIDEATAMELIRGWDLKEGYTDAKFKYYIEAPELRCGGKNIHVR